MENHSKNSLWLDNPILFHSAYYDDYSTFVAKIYYNESFINIPNIYGESVAHYCCYMGLIDKYYALLSMDANPHNSKNGDTLLHYASYGGKDSFLVTELIKNGTSPLIQNKNGITPIHLSSELTISGYFYLWLQSQNIPLLNIVDNENNNISHIAFQNGFSDVAQYWLSQDERLGEQTNSNFEKPLSVVRNPLKVCPI